MKIYSVTRAGEPDSEFLFQADSPVRAADLYMHAVVEEINSVDSSIFTGGGDAERLLVRLMPVPGACRIGMSEGRVDWDEVAITEVSLSDCPSWQDALARGFDPYSGAWDEALEP